MWRVVPILLLGCLLGMSKAYAIGMPQIEHLSKEDFLAQAFNTDEPTWKMLRLNRDLKKKAADILTHPYPAGRIRYWIEGPRTAWIIDEIGKDMPITMGFVVEGGAIQKVRILVYREERGGEVHEEFFTRQFVNIRLQGKDLTKDIDGITGATLSVDAVTRVAKLVLMLHDTVQTRIAATP